VAVVSNSSPLIALAEIEHLPLLARLFESILIPPAVAAEIAPTISTHPAWLRVERLKTPIRPDVMRPSLGTGEREALSLAAELAAEWLIVDDLAARRIARELHLRVTGTLGVLLAAKRRGLIPLLRPVLDRLLEKSFFLSPQLYAELLALAGEERS
jgi:predicted nucleic acid-binding protein